MVEASLLGSQQARVWARATCGTFPHLPAEECSHRRNIPSLRCTTPPFHRAIVTSVSISDLTWLTSDPVAAGQLTPGQHIGGATVARIEERVRGLRETDDADRVRSRAFPWSKAGGWCGAAPAAWVPAPRWAP